MEMKDQIVIGKQGTQFFVYREKPDGTGASAILSQHRNEEEAVKAAHMHGKELDLPVVQLD